MNVVYIGGYQSFQHADQALNVVFYRSAEVCDSSVALNCDKGSVVVLSTSFALMDPNISQAKLIKKIDQLLNCIVQRLQPKGLIYVSSASVYGLRESVESFKEDSKLAGETIYASEKILFERKIIELSNLKSNIIVVRPSAFVGRFKENNPSLVDKCILSIVNKTQPNLKIEFGGMQIRDFCDWTDYLEAIRLLTIRLINKNSNDKKNCLTLNLSSFEPVSIRNLLHKFDVIVELSDAPDQKKIHSILNTERAVALGVMPEKKQLFDWVGTLQCF